MQRCVEVLRSGERREILGGLRLIEKITGMKVAGLKTSAENQCVTVRFPNLAELARVSGKRIVVMKVYGHKIGPKKSPSRIFQENQCTAHIREWSPGMKASASFLRVEIIEEDLVPEPAN